MLVMALGTLATLADAQVCPTIYPPCTVPSAWGTLNVPTREYYYPTRGPGACYKTEAIRQMATPWMNAQASSWSADPRVQEIVVMARGVDILVFDGLRLVRTRGVLEDRGPIDDLAVQRISIYFNVNMSEARAWLIASRLMQIGHYGEHFAFEAQLEQELTNAAGDIALRVETYFGDAGVAALMPRFAVAWGLRMPVYAHSPRCMCGCHHHLRYGEPVSQGTFSYPEVCTPVGAAAEGATCGAIEWGGVGE